MPPDWLDLHGDEEIRLMTHPSRWLMLRELLILVAVTVMVVALLGTGVVPDVDLGPVTLKLLVALLVPIAGLPLLRDFVQRKFTVYVVTDEQVWKKTGFINRNIDPLLLEEIIDIEIHEQLGDRVFNKGEVAMANAASGEFDLFFKHVPNPNEVAGQIRRAKKDVTE